MLIMQRFGCDPSIDKLLLCKLYFREVIVVRHRARVVKGEDSKSSDVSRAGSNPVGVVFFVASVAL